MHSSSSIEYLLRQEFIVLKDTFISNVTFAKISFAKVLFCKMYENIPALYFIAIIIVRQESIVN